MLLVVNGNRDFNSTISQFSSLSGYILSQADKAFTKRETFQGTSTWFITNSQYHCHQEDKASEKIRRKFDVYTAECFSEKAGSKFLE